MKNLNRNSIKVLLGFLAGIILLFFIHELNYIVIALIQTGFFIVFYTIVDKFLDYFLSIERKIRNEHPKWFLKTYKKYQKLVKKRGIVCHGIGCLPIDKHGNWNKEASILLTELLEYEPFLEWTRKELGVDN